MAHVRRASSVRFPAESPSVGVRLTEVDVPFQEWIQTSPALAKDLIDSPAVVVDGQSSIEEACERLITGVAPCLLVQKKNDACSESSVAPAAQYEGLFDHADVNAFLLLGLNARSLGSGGIDNPRTSEILEASKQGHVPVRLACNISEKNPLVTMQATAPLLSLLQVFATGTHRVVAQEETGDLAGVVTDLQLIRWLLSSQHPTLENILVRPISSFGIGDRPVISASMEDTILDAMDLMNKHGVNSVAVVGPNSMLYSAVSVTDIGNIVIPSESKSVLSEPLGVFVSRIKEPAGATDGVDRFPVFSVMASSTLQYTMQKLVATNAHRLFITNEQPTSPGQPGNLRGVVSVVDVLSIFARLAGVPDVDPLHLRRKRRTSSSSSRSSTHSRHSSFSLSAASSPTSSVLSMEMGKKL